MNKYFIKDARQLDSLPFKSKIDLIITSPPYFDMKDYGSKNQIGFGQTYDEYLEDIETVFNKCFSVSKENCSLWVIVDILKKDGEIKLLPFDMAKRIQKSEWKLRDVIIWQKDKTIPYTHKGEMRNIFEYLLYFTKSKQFKFYRERITSINDLKEWWQKYPERYSPNGKSPTNIWDFPIPLQGSWGKRYIKHFCPLPERLIERIIDLSSDINDIVFDPFAGSGAVLSTAYKLQRQYIGCDLNSSYKKMFLDYIKNVKPINVKSLYESRAVKKYSKIIEKLRILKFPKKLYLIYRKKYPEDNSIYGIFAIPISQKATKLPKNKFTSCTYIIISLDGPLDIVSRLQQIAENKPLSKYGIDFNFKVVGTKEALKLAKQNIKTLWRYDNGIIYSTGKSVSGLTIEEILKHKDKKFPPIYSAINIKKDELELPM